jgi:hypothetical protein
MGNKTRLEKEIAAYNGFQHTLRQMTPEEQDQYAAVGTPGWKRQQRREAAYRERIEERRQEIAAFDKERPDLVPMVGMAPEQTARIEQILEDWRIARKRFMADLDTRLPMLEC